MVLTCQVSNLTRPGDPDISWSYKGQELREVQEVNDIDCSRLGSTVTTPFMALDNMLVLVVCDISLAMTGSYSCSLQYSAGDVDDLLASVISDTVSIDVLCKYHGVRGNISPPRTSIQLDNSLALGLNPLPIPKFC